MKKLVQKYVDDLANPCVKIELPESKLNSPSQDDKEQAEKYLTLIETSLRHDRVHKRCDRATGIWLPDDNLVKVTKIHRGAMAPMGYQNKQGKFLYPEEALFLMETNKLEIFYNDAPLSIQQAFDMLLSKPDCNLIKYRVYKKLAVQGYHLLRKLKLQVEDGDMSDEGNEASNDSGEPSCKIKKVCNSDSSTHNMEQRFLRIRQSGPKEYKSCANTRPPDYYVFLPTNLNKFEPDFNLYLSTSNTLDELDFNYCNIPKIYAVCTDDNIAFYKFHTVYTPPLT